MVRNQAPPRVKTAAKRGRGGRGGRGRRGGGNQRVPLDSNEWRFENAEIDSSQDELMRSTIYSCSRHLPLKVSPPEQKFTKEQIEEITKKLETLTLKDQLTTDFISPIPPMEESIQIVQPEPAKTAEDKPKKEEPKDLDSWLDGLLS